MASEIPIQYCNLCGGVTKKEIPPGDNRLRDICNRCGEIQYQNPKIVTGCVPYWGDRVLLCRRAIEPRKGYWTLPAGFMENNETLEQGAARETMEEACAPVINMRLFGIYNLPRISQVYVMYQGELESEQGFSAGQESLEVGLYQYREIPWDHIAFRVMGRALRRFFESDQNAAALPDIHDLY